MLGAGSPPRRRTAAPPQPSFVAQPPVAPARRVEVRRAPPVQARGVAVASAARPVLRTAVAPSRVYYPPRRSPQVQRQVSYSSLVTPPIILPVQPPVYIPPVTEPPVGTVVPFRRPRKQIRQRRGGGAMDWNDELEVQSAENGTIPYAETPPVVPPAPPLYVPPTDTGGEIETGPLPYVTDSSVESDAPNAVESGDPYSVVEGSYLQTDAANAALPESAPPQPDSGEMGDIFADARAWMNSLDPVNRATISASALLDKFNSLLHTVRGAISDFFGKEKLYNNQKAKIGQQLWIADEVVMRLRKAGRPADAQKVLSAAAALQRQSDPVRIDSTNSIIKARVTEFNRLYSGTGVGLGENVSFALAAQLISILTGIMSAIIPGGFAISDFIHRTSEKIVNLTGVMTGMLSAAEYGEIEARSRERFTFATVFKGMAGVLLIGVAAYVYWKWKKR